MQFRHLMELEKKKEQEKERESNEQVKWELGRKWYSWIPDTVYTVWYKRTLLRQLRKIARLERKQKNLSIIKKEIKVIGKL